MLKLLTSLVPSLFKLGDKLIEDKDKKAEYAFKVQDMVQTMSLKLLETKTYPWIDGLVKLAYAGGAITKGLLRPIGAAIMTGFVMYAELRGIQLSTGIEAIMAGAFPAWGASRYSEKKKGIDKKEEEDYDW